MSTPKWFVPDRTTLQAQGPYTTDELVRLISEGSIRPDEYVWGEGQGQDWKRIFEIESLQAVLHPHPRIAVPRVSRGRSVLPETSSARAQAIPSEAFQRKGEYGSENLYRRFPRVPCQTEVLIHNQRIYRKGISVDLSERGVYLNLEDVSAFTKGEEVWVVIRGLPGVPPLAASGVVMRANPHDSGIGIGVYFLRLSPQVRRQIARYVLGKLSTNETQSAA